jgi:hypothetical protein
MCQLKTRRKHNTRHRDEPMRRRIGRLPIRHHQSGTLRAEAPRMACAHVEHNRIATSTSRSGLCSRATPAANKANALADHYPLLRLRKFSVFALNSSTRS